MLDRRREAMFLCDAHGQVMRFNAEAEEIVRNQKGITIRNNRLEFSDAGLQRAVQASVFEACRSKGLHGVTAHHRHNARLGATRWRIEVSRIQRLAGAAHWQAMPVLALVTLSKPPSAEDAARALQRSAGLTKAETDIVGSLVMGLPTREIADRRRTSVETVRSQVKTILSKCGCSSRAELIAKANEAPEAAPTGGG
jgi:DNA-binding CsgD family transcriptional regulator